MRTKFLQFAMALLVGLIAPGLHSQALKAATQHTVTFSVVGGQGGSLYAYNDAWQDLVSGALVPQGANVHFWAWPHWGHIVQEWAVNGVPVAGHTQPSYTLVNLQADTEVTVRFMQFTPGQVSPHARPFILGNPEDVRFTIGWGNETSITEIRLNYPDALGHWHQAVLTQGVDYWVSGDTLTIGAAALQALPVAPPAQVQMSVMFGLGSSAWNRIDVVDGAFPVTFSVVGTGGSLYAHDGTQNLVSGALVLQGADVYFSASPHWGHIVQEWAVNGVPVAGHTQPSYTLVNLQADTEVTVRFMQFTVGQVYPHHRLFILGNPEDVRFTIGWGNETSITEIRLNYTDSLGHWRQAILTQGVDFWVSGDTLTIGAATLQSLPVAPPRHVMMSVVFGSGHQTWTGIEVVDRAFTVTYSVVGTGGYLQAGVAGVGSISSGGLVPPGSDVWFWASPDWGYAVRGWTVNGAPVDGHTDQGLEVLNLQADLAVTVEFFPFIPAQITPDYQPFVLSQPADLNFSISWGDETSITGITLGKWDPIGQQWVTIHLTEGVDYWVSGDTLTIAAAFVQSQNIYVGAELQFEVEFGAGTWSWIMVEAVDAAFPVTFSVVGPGGQLEAWVDGGGSIASGGLVALGRDVWFWATPETGYAVRGWTVNGAPVAGHTGQELEVPNLQADLAVTVEFFPFAAAQITPDYQPFVLSQPADLNFSISWGDETSIAGVTFENWDPIGQQWVIIPLTEGADYWVSGDTLTIAAAFVQSQNLPLGAEFDLLVEFGTGAVVAITVEAVDTAFPVTFSVVGAGGQLEAWVAGRGSFASGGQVGQGSDVWFWATPETGYAVRGWTVNGAPVAGHTGQELEVPNLQADLAVTVEFFPFAAAQITPDYQPFVLSQPADLNFSISWGDETSIAQLVHAYWDPIGQQWVLIPLTEGADYWVSGNTLSIAAAFIQSLSPTIGQELEFGVQFGSGAWLEITVEAVDAAFPVTFSVVGAGGQLEASVAGVGPISSGAPVASGRDVELRAWPEPGHAVRRWTVNGAPVAGHTGLVLEIPNLQAALAVNVEFIPLVPAQIAPLSQLFNLAQPQDLRFQISWGDETSVEGITLGHLDPIGGQWVPVQPLTEGVDYRVSGDTLTIAAAFIQSLSPTVGQELEFGVEFGSGAEVTIAIEVVGALFFEVTFSVVGTGGQLTASVVGVGPISSGVQVAQGQDVEFTAAPAAGYQVQEWLLNGQAVANHTALTYTLTDLAANADVHVVFIAPASAIAPALTELRAYPNPFRDQINIAGGEWVSRVTITNALGQQVMSLSLNGAQAINTSGLRAGVYLVIFQGPNGEQVVRRMVKQ